MTRRWPILLVAVVVFLIGYAAWPLLDLRALANAIEARDAKAFVARVDIPQVKRSLAAQVVRMHLKVTGKDQRMSPRAIDLAVRAGVLVADAYLVEIVRAEGLIDLLKEARAETFGGASVSVQGVGWPNLRNVGRLLAAEYVGRDFYVMVPLGAADKDSFRLRLRLTQWQWKLAGIEVPETVALRLEQEIRATLANR